MEFKIAIIGQQIYGDIGLINGVFHELGMEKGFHDNKLK
jgi:hypothetical protein